MSITVPLNPMQRLDPRFQQLQKAVKTKNKTMLLETTNTLYYQIAQIINSENLIDSPSFKKNLTTFINEIYNTNPLLEQCPSPRGLENISNNCWANALIHLLVRSPSIFKSILESEDERIAPIRDILNAYLQGKPVNSQAFRCALADLVAEEDVERISRFANTQIDVMQGYQVLMQYLDLYLPCRENRKLKPLDETLFMRSIKTTESLTACYLNMQQDALKSSFAELMQGFLEAPIDGTQECIGKEFENLPDDLVIHVRRFYYDNTAQNVVKNKASIQGVPERLTIPAKHTKDKTAIQYIFSGCIIHLGESLKEGHFLSLEQWGDTFYHINDESVFKWDDKNQNWILKEGFDERNPIHNERLAQTPDEMMAQGYLFYYRKKTENCKLDIYKELFLGMLDHLFSEESSKKTD